MRRLEGTQREFWNLIAHEVRTPLTAILRGIDLWTADLRHGDTVMSIVQRNGERLDRFLAEVLVMADLAVGRRLRFERLPVAQLLAASFAAAPVAARLVEARVVNELAAADWCWLGDAVVLRQALDRILVCPDAPALRRGDIRVREVDVVPGRGSAANLRKPEVVRAMVTRPEFAAWRRTPLRWRLVEFTHANTPAPRPADAARVVAETPPPAKTAGPSHLAVGARRAATTTNPDGQNLALAIARQAVELHGGRLVQGEARAGERRVYVLLPAISAASVEKARDGLRGAAGHEEIDQRRDAAPLEVEL